ncbi:MAG TPA: DUF2892 domain-containing protein [Cytophagales bacterium]|jgi:hypothetical protein|nr:DUF2892 domain-containing protein [Cytophagales bacterium]
MSRNISTRDRILRLFTALILVVLFMGSFITGTVSYVALAVAAILFITSIVGLCPLYKALNIRTKKQSS